MVLKAAEFVRRGLPSPSKFSPNWDGPYIVREAYESGYYKLSKFEWKVAKALLLVRYIPADVHYVSFPFEITCRHFVLH